jgi:hypothetical protein
MTIRRRNPRHQGDLGVVAAIGYLASEGYRVAVPLSESQPWDLIVDRDGEPAQRVQVKTTTCRLPNGVFTVHLATNGGNQSWNGISREFDPEAVEWLFVLTDDLEWYFIPSSAIQAKTQLKLGRKVEAYRVRAAGRHLRRSTDGRGWGRRCPGGTRHVPCPLRGGVPEWPKGAVCKTAAKATLVRIQPGPPLVRPACGPPGRRGDVTPVLATFNRPRGGDDMFRKFVIEPPGYLRTKLNQILVSSRRWSL